MSNVATGSIEGQGNNFTGRFDVDGRPMKFVGSLSQAVGHFKSTTATLIYYKPSDVDGAFGVTVSDEGVPSFVGEETLIFNLKNQRNITLTISGNLAASIDDRQIVTGEGKWFDGE